MSDEENYEEFLVDQNISKADADSFDDANSFGDAYQKGPRVFFFACFLYHVPHILL